MTFDPSKMTPASWAVIDNFSVKSCVTGGDGACIVHCYHGEGKQACEANAAFIVLARNAFDILMRRGWAVEPIGVMWYATRFDEDQGEATPVIPWKNDPATFADPFTALVEADRWYRENVEAK